MVPCVPGCHKADPSVQQTSQVQVVPCVRDFLRLLQPNRHPRAKWSYVSWDVPRLLQPNRYPRSKWFHVSEMSQGSFNQTDIQVVPCVSGCPGMSQDVLGCPKAHFSPTDIRDECNYVLLHACATNHTHLTTPPIHGNNVVQNSCPLCVN